MRLLLLLSITYDLWLWHKLLLTDCISLVIILIITNKHISNILIINSIFIKLIRISIIIFLLLIIGFFTKDIILSKVLIIMIVSLWIFISWSCNLIINKRFRKILQWVLSLNIFDHTHNCYFVIFIGWEFEKVVQFFELLDVHAI